MSFDLEIHTLLISLKPLIIKINYFIKSESKFNNILIFMSINMNNSIKILSKDESVTFLFDEAVLF